MKPLVVRVHLQAEGHPIANDPCYGATESTESAQNRKVNSSERSDVSIWLHALYHGGDGWAFRSDLPDWARYGCWEEGYVSKAIRQILTRTGEAAPTQDSQCLRSPTLGV